MIEFVFLNPLIPSEAFLIQFMPCSGFNARLVRWDSSFMPGEVKTICASNLVSDNKRLVPIRMTESLYF